MTTLGALARVLRSKNAGPTLLTLDLIFDDPADCDRAREALSPATIAALYGVAEAQVRIHAVPAACALKIVLPRVIVAGSPFDRDVYGAQQHGPLLTVPV